MKILLILTICTISFNAFSEDKIMNAFDQNRPSLAFLATGYHRCVQYDLSKKETLGQAVSRCSCLGEYAADHIKISMSHQEQEEITKKAKIECDHWLSRITITEAQ